MTSNTLLCKDPIENELLNEVNLVLTNARALLRKQGIYFDIVLVVDNLEKVRKAMGKDDLRESYQALFLDKAPEFNGVQAHAIYTFPLELLRSSMANIANRFDIEPSSLDITFDGETEKISLR